MLFNKPFTLLTTNVPSIRFISTKTLRPKKFKSILSEVPACPQSGWQIYVREEIEKQKKNGSTKVQHLTKELSPKWKSLSEQEKEKFHDIYKKEYNLHKEKYDEALQKATPQVIHDENILRKKYNLPLLKDPKKPKRPMNAYMFYLESIRHTEDYRHLSVAEQAHTAAKAYKALNPDDKKIFETEAKKRQQEYKKAIEDYNKQIR
ncbi:unnamed protein product [Cunninghamella blakesleeana]